MSDTCYMEIAFREEDTKEISKIFGYNGDEFWNDVVESDHEWIKVSIHHANYGYHDARELASSKGFVFYGYCGEGGGYSSCLFVSFGGKHIEANEVNRWPAARLDDSGDVMPDDVKDGKEYLLYHQLAVKFMEGSLNAQDAGGKPNEGSV